MSKPAYINPIYTIGISFDISDLEEIYDIKWEDVQEYSIAYGMLLIEMKDGSTHEHDFYIDQASIAGKYPEKIIEYDEKWNVLEEKNEQRYT